MSQEQENEVLIKVTLDEEATDARIKAINAQLKFFKDTVKDLEKDLKSGAISQNQYDEALGRITVQSKKLTSELAYQKKALDDSKKGIVANSGSLNEMRAKAQAAAAEYSALSKAERENDKVGGELLKRVQDLNKEYEEQNAKLTTTRKTVVDFVRDLEPFGVNIGQTFDAFKSSGQSIATFVKGLGSIKNAIAATGIGLLLLALGALYTYLTKTQAGMDYLERKTAGLSAVFQKLTGIVVEVGEKIFKAVENPKAAIKELADFVETNLTNRFRAFGVILDAIIHRDWKAAVDGVIQLGTGITNASSRAEQFANDLGKVRQGAEAIALESQKIRDAEIKLNVERAQSLAKIEQLKKVADDQTKSTKERESAAKQAYALENDLLQKSIALQQRKIANVKAEVKQGQDTVEARRAVAEEEIKLAELVEQSATRTTEVQNTLNSIRKEGADLALATEKKAANEQIAYWERALIQAKRKKEDTLEIEEQIIKLRAKAELIDSSSTDKKGAQERLLIQAKAEADILELRTQKAIETAARLTNIKESEIKALLAVVKEGTLAELELNKALIQNEAQQQKDQVKATITNKSEQDAKIKQIDAETKKRLLDADKAYFVKQSELAQQRIDLQQRVSDTLMARFKHDQEIRLSDQEAENASALALAKEGSKAELDAGVKTINDRMNRELMAEKLTDKARRAIVDTGNREIEDLRKRYILKTIDEVSSILNQATEAISNLVSAQSQRMFDELDKQQEFALQSAGTNTELRAKIEEKYAKKRVELEKEVAKKKQKFASIENVINTAASITKAFVEYGPILGAILGAIALANGIAQQMVIDSQKFAKGGVIKGPSHAQGGIQMFHKTGAFVGEMEGDEIILTKGVYQNPALRAQASALNVAGGGRAFGGVIANTQTQRPYFNYGGVTSLGNDNSQLARILANEVNKVQPILVVDDVNSINVDRARLGKRVKLK